MELTRSEFYAKYGDVSVKFSSYYKYTFAFSGVTKDGDKLVVGYGGNNEQIYRFDCSADAEVTVMDLQPYEGYVMRDGVQIDSFYDY
jgi:hypothetical protein